MDLRKLQKIAVTALEDIKARDIEVINTSKLTSLFDRIIVASADSTRQVKALARNVHDKVKEAGGEVLSMEGEETGEWVLVDLDTIVVHVMQPSVRSYYNLEELWQGKRSLPPAPLPKEGGDDGSLRSQAVGGPRLGAARRRGLPTASPTTADFAQSAGSGGAKQRSANSRLRPTEGGDDGSLRPKEVPAGRPKEAPVGRPKEAPVGRPKRVPVGRSQAADGPSAGAPRRRIAKKKDDGTP